MISKYLYNEGDIFYAFLINLFLFRHFTTMSTSLPLGSSFFLQSMTFLTLLSSCHPASGTLKILFPWMKSRVYGLKNKTWRHLRNRKISQRKTKPKKPPWKKRNLRFVIRQNNAIFILQIVFCILLMPLIVISLLSAGKETGRRRWWRIWPFGKWSKAIGQYHLPCVIILQNLIIKNDKLPISFVISETWKVSIQWNDKWHQTSLSPLLEWFRGWSKWTGSGSYNIHLLCRVIRSRSFWRIDR